MTTWNREKAREQQIRRLAAHYGYEVKKSRQRLLHLNNHGEFMLVRNGTIVQGERFDASLDDIYRYIRAMEG